MGSLVSILQHRLFNLKITFDSYVNREMEGILSNGNLKNEKKQGKTLTYTWHFSYSPPL